jgi:hypothetical protein
MKCRVEMRAEGEVPHSGRDGGICVIEMRAEGEVPHSGRDGRKRGVELRLMNPVKTFLPLWRGSERGFMYLKPPIIPPSQGGNVEIQKNLLETSRLH